MIPMMLFALTRRPLRDMKTSHLKLLAAGLGSEVELETEGEDEQQAADAIAALVNDKFGEGQ